MAIEILDEHEQGEVVRRWLSKYGGALVGGIALGLAAVLGVQQWQQYRVEQRVMDASQFQQLVDAYAVSNLDQVAWLTAEIKQRRVSTPYAALASLREADSALEAGEQERAAVALQWVIDNTRDAALKDLATLRLARVRLAQDEAQQALTLLGAIRNPSFAALAAEVRGDALTDLGRRNEAAAAYREGLEGDGAQFARTEVLRMKLDNLGDAPVVGSES